MIEDSASQISAAGSQIIEEDIKLGQRSDIRQRVQVKEPSFDHWGLSR